MGPSGALRQLLGLEAMGVQVTWLTKWFGYFSPLADKVKEASFLFSKWWLFYSDQAKVLTGGVERRDAEGPA